MVVEIYPGPDSSGASPRSPAVYTSKRWSCTVNGIGAFVYGREQQIQSTNTYWTIGDVLELSWLKLGVTEPVTIIATWRDPVTGVPLPITSYELYPHGEAGVTSELIGGQVRIVAPPQCRPLRLEVNGERRHPMHFMLDPPVPPRPAGAVDFLSLGSITSLPPGSTVYFPRGIHVLGGPVVTSLTGATGIPGLLAPRLFLLSDNCTIHFEPGAVVEGSFDVTSTNGVVFQGAGTISGLYVEPYSMWNLLSTTDKQSFAAIASFGGSNTTTNRVQDIVACSANFWTFFNAASKFEYVHAFNAWYGNTDAFSNARRDPDFNYTLTGCLSVAGDDNLLMNYNATNFILTRCFAVNYGNSCYSFGYWPAPFLGYYRHIIDCAGMSLTFDDANVLPEPYGPGEGRFRAGFGIFRLWMDGAAGEELFGAYSVVIRNFQVCGPVLARVFAIGNFAYPFEVWGARTGNRVGTAANWRIDGMTIEQVPGQLSLLEGKDRFNTPCDFRFDRVTIAGRPLEPGNFFEFFETPNAYGIYVGGREVVTSVDLCNLALARIGIGTTIDSIAPVDGSAESDVCARFYSLSLSAVAQRHPWSFATRRVVPTAVVDGATGTTWDHAYTVPGDLLDVVRAMPPGETDETRALPETQYAMETVATGDRRLFSRQPLGLLVYSVVPADPNQLTPLAQDAVVWKLAANIAGPLLQGTSGAQMSDYCGAQYERVMREAMRSDSRSRRVVPDDEADFLRARN